MDRKRDTFIDPRRRIERMIGRNRKGEFTFHESFFCYVLINVK
jgi:hypothetical protein